VFVSRAGTLDFDKLSAFNGEPGVVHVVIETEKGSRNKLAYDQELGLFRLKKVLPQGMSFPFDFGFIPSTVAGDGDPLDVLVMMDEPARTGCLVECRIIGAIRGEQTEKGRKVRNDRLLGIAIPSRAHSDLKNIRDIHPILLSEVETFFVNYQQEFGVKFRVTGRVGPREALRIVRSSLKHQGK
jgi:inorganic pyrophosphatase